MRNKVVAANWKMNILPSEAKVLVSEYADNLISGLREIIIFPPFTHLAILTDIAPFILGAQNCHEQISGAYTGEISCDMIVNLKCRYVLIGHSERRMYEISENKRIPLKIKRALQAGLKIIYCCGEPLDVRKQNQQNEFVYNQMKHDLSAIEKEYWPQIIIAYEPIWAIGTGQTASPQQAQEMHFFIREKLKEMYDEQFASNCSILYGGSVKATNAKDLSSQPDIDGVLVGGASLSGLEFMSIANAF